MTFTGTVANLNNALAGASFAPDADYNGAASLQVVVDDQGNTGSGGARSATRSIAIVVTAVDDAPTGLPLIVGSAVEDQTLTVDTAGIADADGLGAFAIQWLRNGADIAGATAASYRLGDADVGATLSVRVGWTDGQGHPEMLTSAATAGVANVNDEPTGRPAIVGVAAEDQTLVADTGTLADADGLGSLDYQWQRDGVDIAGAVGPSYTLGDADTGSRIAVRVGWIDGHGTVESSTSTATAAVANSNDAPVGSVEITGTVSNGQTLVADASGLSDADGIGAFHYQWHRDGVAIAGATGESLLLAAADVGSHITVVVGWTDGWGTAETVASAATAAVTGHNNPTSGLPVVDGDAVENGTLVVDTSAIADADGLGPFSYQWLRNGVDHRRRERAELLPGDADVGRAISVRVGYTDGNGTGESVTSAATAPIANVNDAPTGLPLIAGNADRGPDADRRDSRDRRRRRHRRLRLPVAARRRRDRRRDRRRPTCSATPMSAPASASSSRTPTATARPNRWSARRPRGRQRQRRADRPAGDHRHRRPRTRR